MGKGRRIEEESLIELPIEAEDLDVAGIGAAAKDGDESARGIAHVGFDFDVEDAAADVGEIPDLTGNFETEAGHSVKKVTGFDAAERAGKGGAIIFHAASRDNGFGSRRIHARDKLEGNGGSGIDVHFGRALRRKKISQPDGVSRRRGGRPEAMALLVLLLINSTVMNVGRARTPKDLGGDAADHKHFGKVIDWSIFGLIIGRAH